jgi:hypothetical protein
MSSSVRIMASPDVPVEVTSFASPTGLSSPGSYSIRNSSSAGLVTLVLRLTFVSNKGERISKIQTVDSWDRDRAFLDSGKDSDFPLQLGVNGFLREVEVLPVYAEFDDGSRMGPAAQTLRPCFLGEREAVLKHVEEARSAFRSGGKSALFLAIQKPDLAWLQVMWSERGLTAVVAELEKNRRLRP